MSNHALFTNIGIVVVDIVVPRNFDYDFENLMDSSDASYKSITLLQGHIGSAIELGTYGIGIR